ncbi:MAG: pyruvate kinase [Clostridia bacterium]|nr:pyruvate kinase [Clostridia bacterium]
MRKTKIVCTIGPACNNRETLKQMYLAGMNVARINCSHGDKNSLMETIALIKSVREELNAPIAIMLDTKGPEYRIKTFKDGKVFLNDGDTFTFTAREIEGDENAVSVSYKNLATELTAGDTILLNNGLLIFKVREIKDEDIICDIISGGELGNRKSMSFPGKVLKQKYLSEQDKEDILIGIKEEVEFIACSFVSSKQDLLDIKEFIKQNTDIYIDLIAKIENRSGVDNIEEICTACDGIMVARGDMGVEIPFEELPTIQKKLITKCRLLGKRIITATEMLESMIHNPRPTRAEISDVANAVYDGTSAIMLSGETAAGKYPVLTVETMSKIAEQTEENINYKKRFYSTDFEIKNVADALSHSACAMSIDIKAKAIVVCSLSGITARMVSRFRSPVDIIGLTVHERTWRKLSLSWGVTPVMSEIYKSTDVLFYTAENVAKERLGLNKGDKIVITGGTTDGITGNTNLIKIETI